MPKIIEIGYFLTEIFKKNKRWTFFSGTWCTLCLNHHCYFICPITEQYAHLHQYNLEEQDSKVRQEH